MIKRQKDQKLVGEGLYEETTVVWRLRWQERHTDIREQKIMGGKNSQL